MFSIFQRIIQISSYFNPCLLTFLLFLTPGVPDYLGEVGQNRLVLQGEAERERKAAADKERAKEVKKEAWKKEQDIRAKSKKVRYSDPR